MKNLTKELKSYIIKKVTGNDNSCEDLLGSNEALKDFARIWEKHEAALKIVLAMVEYNFTTKNNYKREELAALKQGLGKIGLFFQGCDDEMKVHRARKPK